MKLVDLQVLQSSYSFHPPLEDSEIDRQVIFDQYVIEFDFAIEDFDESTVLLFLKCGVNLDQADPLPGYELFAEMINVFDVSRVKKELSENDFKNMVVYSGLSIAVNNIRSCFYQLTMQGPLKEYLLPAIDVNTLVRLKSPKKNDKSKTVKRNRK